MEDFCVKFENEKERQIKPFEIIQGVIFRDLGNDYANPPLPSAYPGICDMDHDGKNELIIRQGTIRLEPLSRGPFFVTGVAAHWFGGVGVTTITGHDINDKPVSIANNLVGQQGIFENIILFDPDIWYITIRGVEVALDKICFFR